MTVLLNPTLRDPGPTPGSAAHWTLTSVCAAQRLAAFAPAPSRAWEDFERWTTLATSFPEGSVVLAFFDPVPKGYEAFDGWAGGAFLDAFPDVLLDPFLFAGVATEAFDGWLTAPWASTWADVAPDVATFGGAPVDDFEAWSAPLSPAWANATFAPGAGAAEPFEAAWTAMTTL